MTAASDIYQDENIPARAQALAWPADGPREEHAIQRLQRQSFNARKAMLAACPAAENDDAQAEKQGETHQISSSLCAHKMPEVD